MCLEWPPQRKEAIRRCCWCWALKNGKQRGWKTTCNAAENYCCSCEPNNFEKMKVNLAFSPFQSAGTLRPVILQQINNQAWRWPCTNWRSIFPAHVESNTSDGSTFAIQQLKPGSTQEEHTKDVFEYLNAVGGSQATSAAGFLSVSTAEGLKVTLQVTLHFLRYLHDKCRLPAYMLAEAGMPREIVWHHQAIFRAQ